MSYTKVNTYEDGPGFDIEQNLDFLDDLDDDTTDSQGKAASSSTIPMNENCPNRANKIIDIMEANSPLL